MIRVLIVSERALVRAGLRHMLQSTPRPAELKPIEVAGESADVIEATAAMAEVAPGIVLVDFARAASEAIDATAELCRRAGSARVVALGGHDDVEHARAALANGAAGFLWKGADVAELEDAIRTVDAGATYVSPQIAEAVRSGAPSAGTGVVGSLSKREFEVMCFLASGMTNREIAEQLGISVKTIDTHRGHVLKKLQLRNNSDITRFAIRHGFVRL
ncbi:MAG TPA: response regulator transcription factor [Kofleriaceae bacterium]|nr:response regulator transcription factor [Kofleriaceae bacterium]